jgi:ABC-type branched-subunit amino acid transport system ATPase component
LIPDKRPRYLPGGASRILGSLGRSGKTGVASSRHASEPVEVLASLVRTRHDMSAFNGSRSAKASHAAIMVASNVEVAFGGLRAVDRVSLAVSEGSVTGLIGPNGAGKSTLINVLSGLQHFTAGQVSLDGRDISHWSPARRAQAGVVRTFQLSREFARLTTFENLIVSPLGQRAESAVGVIVGRRHWGEEEERNVEHARLLLELFEMSDKADELAGNLSGGQKRMVEFMRALMTRPRLILLDEPIAGLSNRWSDILEKAVHELRRQGLSVILVEHELGIIERLCDSVIVMANGSVLAEGSMTELRGRKEVQAAYVIG